MINTKNWQHKRGTIGDIVVDENDIGQCIQTIMGLQKGAVPFSPELGCEILEAIGENAEDSIRILKAIYTKEIPKQEPRCQLISITGEYTENGQIHMIAYYKTKNSENIQKSEIYI